MPPARIGAITLDVTDLDQARTFWSSFLELEPSHADEQYVYFTLNDDGLMFGLQKVPETKTSKNRAHPDIAIEDINEAIARVTSLGGSVIQPPAEGATSAIMADPEGNEFCMGTW